MKDIVTKYKDIIEDSELLLGDNNNLKNMSYNDIDEICNYVLKEYVQEFLYYDGTTSSYRYIRAKLKEIKGFMEQGIDDKYLYRNYEEVVDVLEGFLEILEAKYDKMKINLRKNYY